mgnify:CR=1 FL=1
MLENMIERLPIAIAFLIAGLVCYVLSQRPALSKKEEQELKELDDIIAEAYGFKK